MNVATLSLLTVFDVAANLYESDNKYIQCFGALGFGQALSPSYLYELDNERRVFCMNQITGAAFWSWICMNQVVSEDVTEKCGEL